MAKTFRQPLRSRDVQSSLARIQSTSKQEKPTGVALTVWATAKGFYGGNRIRPGAQFTLTDAKHFSSKWMSRTDPKSGRPAATEPDVDAGGSGDNPIGAE